MTEFRDDEKHLSQIPALHLLQNLGFRMLTRAETEVERAARRSNVVLESILRERLHALNRIRFRGREHRFSEANVDTAIERLKAARSTGLQKSNEAVTDLLQLGTSLDQTIDGETRGFQLRYVDWEDWRSNAFHVSAEFDVEKARSTEARRPDIVLFVNGIPFAVIECKGPREDLEQAISQMVRNQREDEIAALFHSVQLVIATNKNEVKYGTVGTASKFWSRWREREDAAADVEAVVKGRLDEGQMAATFSGGLAEDRPAYEAMLAEGGGRSVAEQDGVLHALCRPERLLDLPRRFTLFDAGVKKIARYQQFFAVKATLSRIKQRDGDGRRKGGVIWHTQGSGKSITMVMMARALALDPEIDNPRIVLVTDRVDLDQQLKKTFAACGMEPEQAKSGRHLLELVGTRKAAIVTTLINKFDTALRVREFADPSGDVFLLVDESHRTQYGSLHPRMRKVFPNACYLGFTGTPLMKKEKSTFARFGGVIDVYSVTQAVQDDAVVPLLYEGRVVEREVNTTAIDRWFERVCEDLSDQQKADLKKKYARASHLGQTEQTIFCIAFDISEHYRQNWQGRGFKAQLVTPSKRAALLYKRALHELGHVTSEVIISPPDEREGHEEVDEEPTDEIQRFWKKMMDRFGSEKEYNDRIIESFKRREEPEILIVVDKLLTGFDAPKNTVLYLCRKLKEHSLLQAIARVNRVEEGKDFGYIVDYEGVLGELDQALTSYSALAGYDEADLKGAVSSIREEVAKLPQRHSELWDLFKEIPNKRDEEAFEQHLADESRRDAFYERLTAFSRVLAIALSSADFVNDPKSGKRIAGYRADLRRFQNLRTAVRRRYQEAVDFADYEPRIRKLLDTHISAHEVTPLTDLVNIFDEEAFEKAVAEQTTPAAKADLIASAAKRTITERMREDPAFYERFSRLIQQVIDDFRAKRILELEYLKRAREIRDRLVGRPEDEVPEVLREDDDARAVYGVILSFFPNRDAADVAALAAKALVEIIQRHRIVNWTQNADVQKMMMNDMDDYLFDVVRGERGVQLSADDIDEIIGRTLQTVRYRAEAA